jgi:hypothetical protein
MRGMKAILGLRALRLCVTSAMPLAMPNTHARKLILATMRSPEMKKTVLSGDFDFDAEEIG